METGIENTIVDELKAYIQTSVHLNGGSTAPIAPGHRVPFHWPPHPISKDFHVLQSDWSGRASLTLHGEHFDVDVARTAQGIFGRLDRIWNEAKAPTVEQVLEQLKVGSAPYFERQFDIGRTLGLPGRFTSVFKELSPIDYLKLLYCPNRDVAHSAQLQIESHASSNLFGSALIAILEDNTHPHRRSAQWCVLDMFEDLPSFCREKELQNKAIEAIRSLIWNAEDDYARTIYKAGVVLGGHICTHHAAECLLECVLAPSKFGRRSAIHAVFHLAEWMPEHRERVTETLELAAREDSEVLLRDFASSMERDVKARANDHMAEPKFPEER